MQMVPSDSSQSHAPGASGNDLTQTMQRWRDDILDQPTHDARLHHATCTLAEMTGATKCSIVVPLGRSGLRVLASSEVVDVGDLIVARERYPELEYVLTSQASLLIPMTWESEQLNRRIEEADVIKARFLSSSAHELKTPLTIIQSYLETLVSDLSDGMTEEQISFLRVSYESVLRFKRLVVHVVDIAALESGKLHFEMERVELPALLCELEHEMAALAHSMQIQLTVQLSPSAPAIRTDAQRIRQVFRNLIENAIRFTPKGGSIAVTTEVGVGTTFTVTVPRWPDEP